MKATHSMAEDYYKILGVSRTATASEIQKAYRSLARKHHPDMNPDDKSATKRFQEIQKAYDVIGDESKRKMYDQFGSSYEQAAAAGANGPNPWAGRGGAAGGNPLEGVDLEQLFGGGGPFGGGGGFESIFGGGRGPRPGGRSAPRRGEDLSTSISIPFNTAVLGGTAQISVDRGGKRESIEMKIPAGVEDGQKIRLKGQGGAAPGGTAGDLIVQLHVAAHPFFRRQGSNLEVRLPLTLAEAALGAKIDVPTPAGEVTMKIPPGSNSGARLRIKGQGVKNKDGSQGDLYVELQIKLPENLNQESLDLVKQFDDRNPMNPRQGLVW